MSDLRTAAQAMLKAVEPVMAYGRAGSRDVEQGALQRAHDALRAALAAEPQPVAWTKASVLSWLGDRKDYKLARIETALTHKRTEIETVPLYTAAHTAQPLTDERVVALGKHPVSNNPPWGIGSTREDFLRAVRNVLSAHGIGGTP